MTREQTIERIEKLKGMKIAHATAKDVIKDLSIYTKEDIELLDEYFSSYMKRQNNCIWCEEHLYVDWDLAHGEASCCECGYGSRVYHYPKISNGKELDRIIINLQYHPDDLHVNEETK